MRGGLGRGRNSVPILWFGVLVCGDMGGREIRAFLRIGMHDSWEEMEEWYRVLRYGKMRRLIHYSVELYP